MTSRRARPLVLAALVPAVLALTACGTSTSGHSAAGRTASTPTTSARTTSAPTPKAETTKAVPARPKTHTRSSPKRPVRTTAVHVGFFQADDQTYGVGMPVIVRFTHRVTDRAAFQRAARVLLDGRPAQGAWAWENSPAPGFAVEAHYRLAGYWPAHSHVSVSLPVRGLSAGKGLVYDNSPTLSMYIGAAHVSTIDFSATSPTMTVTSDGRTVRTLPVSLGDAQNPTYRGTKIVEEFDRYQDMGGTSVPWSVRITTSGEFVHAAPWNSSIGRANLSHGCTNLSTADAEWFFHFSRLGDVLLYPNAPGDLTPATDGIGDWNVPWGEWRTGPFLG